MAGAKLNLYFGMRVTKDIGRRKHEKEPKESENSIMTEEDIAYLNSFVMDYIFFKII